MLAMEDVTMWKRRLNREGWGLDKDDDKENDKADDDCDSGEREKHDSLRVNGTLSTC